MNKGQWEFQKYTQLSYSDRTKFEIYVLKLHVHSSFKQDVFVKHNAPDNVQFQRRPRSQDKYFDTSRKILSQEITKCNMEALASYF